MTKESFKTFVNEKRRMSIRPPIDWEKEKNTWLAQLETLKSDISSWLAPYIQDQSVKLSTEMVHLTEEDIGSYTAPMTIITIGGDTVRLEPIGTSLIGAAGAGEGNA